MLAKRAKRQSNGQIKRVKRSEAVNASQTGKATV